MIHDDFTDSEVDDDDDKSKIGIDDDTTIVDDAGMETKFADIMHEANKRNTLRVQTVQRASNLIVDYQYDTSGDRWCTIVYQVEYTKF
jgi:hypothetical protein